MRGPGTAFDVGAIRVLAPVLRDIGEDPRATLLRRSVAEASSARHDLEHEEQGPAVVVVGSDDTVLDQTPRAARLLAVGPGAAPATMAALRFRYTGTESIRVRTRRCRKTVTQSRQTLVSHLVFDHYLPRRGAPVGPRGWFVD